MKKISLILWLLIPLKLYSQYQNDYLDDPQYYLENNIKEIIIERYDMDNVKDTGYINLIFDKQQRQIIEKDYLISYNDKKDLTRTLFFNSKGNIYKTIINRAVLDSDKRNFEIEEFNFDNNNQIIEEKLKVYNENETDTFYCNIVYKYFNRPNFIIRDAIKTEWSVKDKMQKIGNYKEITKLENNKKVEYKSFFYSDSSVYVKYDYKYSDNKLIKDSDLSNTSFKLFNPKWIEYNWTKNLITRITIFRKGQPTEYYVLKYKK